MSRAIQRIAPSAETIKCVLLGLPIPTEFVPMPNPTPIQLKRKYRGGK